MENKSKKPDLVSQVTSWFRTNPALASIIVIFIILNGEIDFISKIISLLEEFGFPDNVDESSKWYALFVASISAFCFILYYILKNFLLPKNHSRKLFLVFFRLRAIFANSLRFEILPLAVAGLFLNISGSIIAYNLNNYFFLDTLGTFIVAVTLGPFWGGAIGLLTNTSLLVLSNNAFLFGVINAWLGIYWGYAAKTTFGRGVLISGRADSILKSFLLFLVPAVIISSLGASIIKTSIYDPSEIQLFFETSWSVSEPVLRFLTAHMSVILAHFLTDLIRNIPDKIIVVQFGLVIFVIRSVRLKLPLQDGPKAAGLYLPIRKRGRGASLVFATMYLLFLFFILPFHEILDRASGQFKVVHVSLLSWFVLSAPLYLALFDLVVHRETLKDGIERIRLKRERIRMYSDRISTAYQLGVVRWIAGPTIIAIIVIACYVATVAALSMVSGSSGISNLTTAIQIIVSMPFAIVAVGVLAVLVTVEMRLEDTEKDD